MAISLADIDAELARRESASNPGLNAPTNAPSLEDIDAELKRRGAVDQPDTMLNKTASVISKGMNFINNPSGQDMSGVNTMEPQGNNMFAKAGGNVAEYLGGKNLPGNPYTAAAVGTAVSMANPINWLAPEAKGPVSLPGSEALQGTAQEAGAKALGYTKRFLNKQGATERAHSVAQTMLDKGVITNPITHPLSSGAGDMLERAQTLGDTSGQAIGEGLTALDQAGVKAFDPKQVASRVYSQLKPGFTGGAYDAQNSIANEIRDTILAHGDGPITFQSAQALKEKLQELGKFESQTNQLKAKMYQQASGVVKKAMEDAIDGANPSSTALTTGNESATPSISPETLGNYKDAKATYGASQQAQKALINRVSSENGNKNIGLTDTIAAAPELAAGHLGKAAMLVGLKRWLEHNYHPLVATTADSLAKTKISPQTRNAALAAFITKVTTKDNAD